MPARVEIIGMKDWDRTDSRWKSVVVVLRGGCVLLMAQSGWLDTEAGLDDVEPLPVPRSWISFGRGG